MKAILNPSGQKQQPPSDVALAAILLACEEAAAIPAIVGDEAARVAVAQVAAVAQACLGNPPPLVIEVASSVSKSQLKQMLLTLAATITADETTMQ